MQLGYHVTMANTTKKNKQLKTVRNALLGLHQTLLNYHRKNHERRHGRMPAPGMLFTLATGNKNFAWLRNLSELIVGLDAYLEGESLSIKNTNSVLKYTKQLLSLKHKTTQFERLYFAAVHKDPEVLLAHHRVMQALKRAQ